MFKRIVGITKNLLTDIKDILGIFISEREKNKRTSQLKYENPDDETSAKIKKGIAKVSGGLKE